MIQVTQEGTDIFSLQLFSPSFLREMARRLSNYQRWDAAGVYYDTPQARAIPGFRVARERRLNAFPFMARAYKSLLASVIKPTVRLCWLRPTDDLTTEAKIVRYDPGGHFDVHFDANTIKPRRLLSLVCYLNADFTGGQTRFLRQNVTISPSPGKAILFPSSVTHPHQALPVLEGRKFVLTAWLCQRPVRNSK